MNENTLGVIPPITSYFSQTIRLSGGEDGWVKRAGDGGGFFIVM
jgi:hypothetical protein